MKKEFRSTSKKRTETKPKSKILKNPRNQSVKLKKTQKPKRNSQKVFHCTSKIKTKIKLKEKKKINDKSIEKLLKKMKKVKIKKKEEQSKPHKKIR